MARPMSAGTVIVGGGVYGAAIAWHLALRGQQPLLLERHRLASGPTGRSSANVRVHYLLYELAELTRRSIEVLRTFRERTGGDCGLVETGFVFLLGPDDTPVWAANVARLRGLGFDLEARDPWSLGDLLPGAALGDVALAIVEPRGGYADPAGTTVGLADAAVRAGATVRVGAAVREVVVASGRVGGVRLEDATIIGADRVVLAAGPWTRALAATAGVDLPLHAERHPIAALDARPDARATLPVVLADLARDYYARPEGSGTIIVGSRDRYPPVGELDAVDLTVDADESADLASRATGRISGIEGLGVRPGWAGLYDCTPDRLPIVDRAPGVEGLVLCCGSSGHGFKMAIALAEQVANLVTGSPTELIGPFRADRPFDPGGRDLGGVVHAGAGPGEARA
jgi:sarcosine oxidase subunit beta